MRDVPVLSYQDFIAAEGDDLFTTSQQVSAVFGKRHGDLLARIRAMAGSLPADRLRYFTETVDMRVNPSGGALIPSASFRISRDGFTLLAMGFTGAKALAFKLSYIDAFNAMESLVKNKRQGIAWQFMQKELEVKTSEQRGSFHGRGLQARKSEKVTLGLELAELGRLAQPGLFVN